MPTIDYAIDLGTTNSLIAKSHQGEVEVFKNPVGHKDTLPSVIAFRPKRTLIGDKAKEYLEKDSSNVVAGFKRKMGTQETFFIPSLAETRSPVALSSMLLQELQNFVYHPEKPEAVVITIPASFDTVQSNATKKAGQNAGFKEVLLLQEPIAACLAFANKHKDDVAEGTWLVYDLGGGTFDAALVSIGDTALKVIDHKGDNYLGGLDFDHLIVEELILPKLLAQDGFSQLKESASQKDKSFQKLYYELLYKAEELKKELSGAEDADIEVYVKNDDGEEEEYFQTITRSAFNDCIRQKLNYSISLVQELLEKNQLTASDVQQAILVGGSTYIPLVRDLIAEEIGIPVNASIDPTSAVVVGAAQYAASKQYTASRTASQTGSATTTDASQEEVEGGALQVRFSFLKTSREPEEMLLAAVEGPVEDKFYRITRQDGGYDSGIKKLGPRIQEMLLLRQGAVNGFEFKVLDSQQKEIGVKLPLIEIVQGLYTVDGQPLPNDICLEVDDLENKQTKLELIFGENSILPLHKTIYREVSKTIYKDQEDKLIVNILEGSRNAMPGTNQVIGVIEIDPSELSNDLIKGGDVEIKVEISESRDIAVTVYLNQLDQTFKDVFSPSERYLSTDKLREEVSLLAMQIRQDLKVYERNEDFELAADLSMMLDEAATIELGIAKLGSRLSGDEKYHLDERKRKLAQRYDAIGKTRKFSSLLSDYYEKKKEAETHLDEKESAEKYRREFQEIIKSEAEVLQSRNVRLLRSLLDSLKRLINEMYYHSDMHMISYFLWFAGEGLEQIEDKKAAQRLIEQGKEALERKNYEELRIINIQLSHLLPPEEEGPSIRLRGTGLE